MAKVRLLTSKRKKTGTVRWLAVELFKRRAKPTEASDVYSLGMILWEIASRLIPFADAQNDAVIVGWIKDGEQEEIPEDTPAEFKSLIEECWSPTPSKRPTALEVLKRLEAARPDWQKDRHEFSIAETDYKGALHVTQGFTPKKTCAEYLFEAATALGVPAAKIDAMVKDCQKLAGLRVKAPLNLDQTLAIVAFTYQITFEAKKNQFYVRLNDALRLRDGGELLKMQGYLYFLFSALMALPNCKQTVYRGIPKEHVDAITANYTSSKKIHWSGFSSTTPELKIAKTFAKAGGILMKLSITQGKDIKPFSAFPGEVEIVLLPNFQAVASSPLQAKNGFHEAKLVDIAETFVCFLKGSDFLGTAPVGKNFIR
eukprot:TRINITY_DN468_c0_g1_i8.p1 TRINITY_DN468_c0_g1~~TRINITY_DN468_c0_g1_i8.p1  ORF type:complete len:415 (+),score=98.25 TRINITY_DN468_c0_g1_i8:136-1245(+)